MTWNGLPGAGGPIGRVFDSRVGNEMVTTNRRDLARLKTLAKEQTGMRWKTPQAGVE